ncbi:MAG: FAD-linked oxidase C-terminal domain-containing protein [Caldilineales bacterium]
MPANAFTAPSDAARALDADLRRAGVQDVRFDAASRVLYSTDASLYQIEPIGVVIPRSVEEIVAAITVCASHRVPILPRGGGTSLAGQTVGRAVVLDTSRHLTQVLEINAAERWIRCQPGLVLDRLNAAARPFGLMLGPDPASGSRATVGGTVGNNGTGAHSILYGMIADNVLAVRAVLNDGREATFDDRFNATAATQGARTASIAAGLADILDRYGDDIRRDFPSHWRRASGYNLDRLLDTSAPNPAQLIAGSEGTLAFMSEVTLRLVPRPPGTVLGIMHFDDLVASAEATPAILELQPSAVELMDRMLLDLCRRQPEFARLLTFVDGDPAGVLAVEFYVGSEAEGRARLDDLRAHLARHGVHGAVVDVVDPARQANVWAVRKAGLSLLLSKRGDVKPAGFMEDVAVPPEHLADYVRGVQRMFAEYGVEAAYYAHASAGCLHIRPLLNLKTARDIALMDEMQDRLLAMIQPVGGVLSGEHGDGIKLTHLNQALFGPRVSEAFAEVKWLFDPGNLFNPGKKVPEGESGRGRGERGERGERETSRHVTDPAVLRYGPGYQTIAFTPVMDWSADGGFAGAVEMCNGSGDCRRLTGAMCPSFHATREEEHSTRGRANLLRTALSGQLDADAWTSDAVHDALDLCLGCKACKVECPSSVDMAKIKTEVLAQRYARLGTPLAARLFGHIHTLNRLAAPLAPLANLTLATPPGKWAARRITGLAPQRSLPSFASQPFTTWFANRLSLSPSSPLSSPSSPLVFLFPDTFTNFNYPNIGIAAVRVLEAAGCEVQIAPHACCGRPMLSQGLVEDARQQARRNVVHLYPLAAQGYPILVCEPSCASAFHEEYRDLLPGDPRVDVVAQHVHLVDDWLAGQLAAGMHLPLQPLGRRVLFHGHCHQKASTGVTGSLAALRALPGDPVELIDAGCCGMAGAFGYTVDHYAVSESIARDRLVPAIEAAPDALVCADGASCRQQIEHFTGRRALHAVEVLAAAL